MAGLVAADIGPCGHLVCDECGHCVDCEGHARMCPDIHDPGPNFVGAR